MAREIGRLRPERRLAAGAGLEVHEARAHEVPACLDEIGRLREITFRGVGEGTGLARDLDSFDQSYTHLVLWNPARGEIAGSYRCISTERVLPWMGPRGFYSSKLFDYDARFFERLGPALELGRSFVRVEYQRSYAALMLLWKGIGVLVARRAGHRRLFGAVSISDRYSASSKSLMVEWIARHAAAAELAQLVSGRNPPRNGPVPRWRRRSSAAPRDLKELSRAVAALEPDGKGMPVLLRRYLELGGRVAALHVDADFGSTLDALVVVDLARAERRTLEYSLGREGAGRVLAGLGRSGSVPVQASTCASMRRSGTSHTSATAT